MIRVILADDHPLILHGIEQLFQLQDDFDVVAQCVDGREALEAVKRLLPDVLIADIRMPELDGLGLLREIGREQLSTRVILLTAMIEDDQAMEGIRLGVAGVVLKQMAPQLLVQAVRKVHAGGQWLENVSYARAIQKMVAGEGSGPPPHEALTDREREIMTLAVQGARNKEIGEKLGISEGTVKAHLHSVYEKLGVTSRVDLTNYARDHGIG